VKDDWKYMQTVIKADDETDDVHAVVTKTVLQHMQTRTISISEEDGPPPEGTLAPI
jgi:hypothetical protein